MDGYEVLDSFSPELRAQIRKLINDEPKNVAVIGVVLRALNDLNLLFGVEPGSYRDVALQMRIYELFAPQILAAELNEDGLDQIAKRREQVAFQIGDKVRVRFDTAWDGIPIEAGVVCKVIADCPQMYSTTTFWLEIDDGSGAQMALDASMLEHCA